MTFPEQSGAPAKQVAVDTPRIDNARVSRKQPGSRHRNPWLYGNWTATSAPVDEAQADCMGEQVDDTDEEVF